MLYLPGDGGILLAGDSAVGPGPEQSDRTPRLERPKMKDEDGGAVHRGLESGSSRSVPIAAVLPLHGEAYLRADHPGDFDAIVANIWTGAPDGPEPHVTSHDAARSRRASLALLAGQHDDDHGGGYDLAVAPRDRGDVGTGAERAPARASGADRAPALFTALTALLAGLGHRSVRAAAHPAGCHPALFRVAGPLGGDSLGSIEALLATRAALGVAVGIVMTTVDHADHRRLRRAGQRYVVMGRQASFSEHRRHRLPRRLAVCWRTCRGARPLRSTSLGLPILYLVWRHVDEPDRTPAPAFSPDRHRRRFRCPAGGNLLCLHGLRAAWSSSTSRPVQVPFYLAELGTPSGTARPASPSPRPR